MRDQICTKCGFLFQRSETSHVTLCCACKLLYDAAWRDKRRAAGLRACGARMPKAYERARERIYRQRPEVKARLCLAAKLRRDDPDPAERIKHVSRWKLNRALASGRITRQLCEVCGTKAHAHHADYEKPLDVRWLCPQHHADIHAHAEGRAGE